ncbi:DUF6139 family protein [Herbaspirillum sp. RTI4]|uniref:DUF6139 family protein n=1 Tax=Herbaspirillum sp. RTI4 TaxID=3048640 RepID=UPI002AB3AC1A|nr:DUF6139 family protein [Herbaspirillum sp. RTI4]MDY7579057.1 DUF6139 family protein [Herbaspirillum sp. RTI4]MEA9982358.1 DUF6139 family protein [Herbaspirillum sp. RTI4]
MMRVDIYKRAESGNLYSYLAVPEEKPLPQEVTSTDWVPVEKKVDITDAKRPKYTLSPADLIIQIQQKGYAITRLQDQSPH